MRTYGYREGSKAREGVMATVTGPGLEHLEKVEPDIRRPPESHPQVQFSFHSKASEGQQAIRRYSSVSTAKASEGQKAIRRYQFTGSFYRAASASLLLMYILCRSARHAPISFHISTPSTGLPITLDWNSAFVPLLTSQQSSRSSRPYASKNVTCSPIHMSNTIH
jgi:hypothetical protein